jgi:hypothetical protein
LVTAVVSTLALLLIFLQVSQHRLLQLLLPSD